MPSASYRLLPILPTFVCCGALALKPSTAYAGQWKVTLHVQGTTRYDNTVNEAWEVLKVDGPAGPPQAATKKWGVPAGETTFSYGAGILMSPTSAALWNGNLGELAGPTTEATQMHTHIENSGSVSVELNWVALLGEDSPGLPPDKIPVVEQASAEGGVDHEITTHPFETIEQEVDCGLPGAINESGNSGQGYPWKKSYSLYRHVIDNPNHSTKIVLGTRHLKAISKGTAGNALWRMHGAGIFYRFAIGLSAPAGNAHLALLKEVPGLQVGQTELFDISGADGATGILCGRAWAGMGFEICPHSRLSPDTTNVQLRIKEDEDSKLGNKQHPDAENHVEPILSLTPGSQPGLRWEKRVGPYGEWAPTTEPFTTPNSSDDTIFYRVLWPWNSHQVTDLGTKLYDHNGLHTVSLFRVSGDEHKEIRFLGIPNPDNIQRSSIVTEFPNSQVDVENLVITNVSTSNGTSDYFKFDPDPTAAEFLKSPILNFAFQDMNFTTMYFPEGTAPLYQWRVRVRPTQKVNTPVDDVVYTGIASSPGSVAVNIAEAQVSSDSQRQQLPTRGAYNFDISVSKYASNSDINTEAKLDSVSLRSKFLSVPELMPAANGTKSGFYSEIVPDPQGGADQKVSYYLRDQLNGEQASSLGVHLLPDSLGEPFETASTFDKTLNTPHLGTHLHQYSDNDLAEGKTGMPIIFGADNHASKYREHTVRSMLAQSDDPLPRVTFEGQLIKGNTLLRACAGSIDDHDAVDPNPLTHNDFQYRAHTRQVDLTLTRQGKPLSNYTLVIKFEGNKGHDYKDGLEKKTARLHNMTDPFDKAHWTEAVEVTTDVNGKVSVWVLSSDIVCRPKLQVFEKDELNQESIKIGELQCDFAKPVALRRFKDVTNYDKGDNGWLFRFPKQTRSEESSGNDGVIADPDDSINAKIYLKFQSGTGTGPGNWQYVNGHDLILQIDSINIASVPEGYVYDESSEEELPLLEDETEVPLNFEDPGDEAGAEAPETDEGVVESDPEQIKHSVEVTPQGLTYNGKTAGKGELQCVLKARKESGKMKKIKMVAIDTTVAED